MSEGVRKTVLGIKNTEHAALMGKIKASIDGDIETVELTEKQRNEGYEAFIKDNVSDTSRQLNSTYTIVMGPPGSGKSARIKELKKQNDGVEISPPAFYPYVSGWDKLMMIDPATANNKVHAEANKMKERAMVELPAAGHNVYFENVGFGVENLAQMVNAMAEQGVKFKVEVLATPAEDAFAMGTLRNEKAQLKAQKWQTIQQMEGSENPKAPKGLVPQRMSLEYFNNGYNQLPKAVQSLMKLAGASIDEVTVRKPLPEGGFEGKYIDPVGTDVNGVTNTLNEERNTKPTAAQLDNRINAWKKIHSIRVERNASAEDIQEATDNFNVAKADKLSHNQALFNTARAQKHQR